MLSDAPASVGALECASFRAVLLGPVIAIRWFGTSEPHEIAALTAFIQKAHETTGGKVDLFAVVPTLDMAPPANVREALVAFAKGTRDALEATDVVLGEGGFWQTIVRSIITSLIILARGHRQTVVHATTDEALARLCDRRRLDRETFKA